jgi:hypothetical protein
LGLKVVTAPAGRPVAERLMDSLNPPVRLMFTVYGAVVDPCTTVWDEGLVEREKSGTGVPQPGIAVQTLSRPPVVVRPARDGIRSTLLRIADFSCAVLSDCRERIRAAEPETWGVAIEVPLR